MARLVLAKSSFKVVGVASVMLLIIAFEVRAAVESVVDRLENIRLFPRLSCN